MLSSILLIYLAIIFDITNVKCLHEDISSDDSKQRIILQTEPSTINECDYGSYKCRMACINDSICYKNDSKNLGFFLVGDTGGLPVYPYITYAQSKTAKSLAQIGDKENVHFTVSVGDNIYFTGVKNEFDKRFQETFENVYQGEALRKPWYFIAGNHDHFGNISGQIAYTNRSRRWTYPSNYYKISYVFGNNGTLVEFLMIDTILLCGNTRDITDASFIDMILATPDKNPNKPKDPTVAKAQFDWIKLQLNDSRADYLFVVGHYPVYSISQHGSMNCLIEKLKPYLEKHHVTAYVAGHDHTLQHIVTEHSSFSDDAEKVPLHYIISGAASRSDPSQKHMDTIPSGSLRFSYPTKANPLSQIGFSSGGFIYVNMNEDNATFRFYNGKGIQKYSCSITPRSKFMMSKAKK